jgi:cytochrome P450
MNSDILNIDHAIADPALYSDPDRYYSLFRYLRQNEPVRWTKPEGFNPFWLVSRYADITEVERQPLRFLNAPRAILAPSAAEQAMAESRENGESNLIRSMNNMDGDDHRQNRAITSRDFLLPSVNRLTEQVDEVAVEFIDRLVAKAPECDFVSEIASWYPLRVVMTLLGVPKEDEAKLLHLTMQIFDDSPTEDGAERKSKAETVEAFFDYFRPIVEDRRVNPQSDIASKIANATIDGKALDDFETYSYFLTLATAGHDTTSSSIAGGLLALLEFPDEMRKLRENPAMIDSLPDEMIRWTAPVKHFFRTASEDCEMAGEKIRKGDSIYLAFPSGCRDEAAFDAPDSFCIDRQNNRHLALGSGPHACLGQHLARLEVRLFYKHLLARIDDIELAGPVKRTESLFISGLNSLPIRFKVRQSTV